MLLLLVLFAVCVVVFGAGFFCGFLVFRRPPSISVTLPASSLAPPLEALQRTIRCFDRQLAEFGERMTHGIEEINAAGNASGGPVDITSLIAANWDFGKQLTAFAADVHTVEQKLATIDTGRKASSGEASAGSTTAADGPGPNDAAKDNCRTEMRHPFFCRQWAAPYDGVRAPESHEFFPVQCRDISSGGISFFLDRTPTYEMIVIRLAGPAESRYLTARIKRTTPSGNLEYGRHVIGCKFLGTLHPSGLPPTLEASIQRREARTEVAEVVAVH
jgi:hypothetical protein